MFIVNREVLSSTEKKLGKFKRKDRTATIESEKRLPKPKSQGGEGARLRHEIQTLAQVLYAHFLPRAQQQRYRGRWLDGPKGKGFRMHLSD